MTLSQTVATIDIGTNSVLLLVARKTEAGLVAVDERAQVTRLGQGVDGTGRLDEAAVERTLHVLREFRRVMDELRVGRLDVVATSALRDAKEAGSFLEGAEEALGVRPRIIAGEEEGALSLLGGVSGLGCRGPVLVVDPGGGSTELCWGLVHEGGVATLRVTSVDVGCVRLTERHIRRDPPSRDQIEAVASDVRCALEKAPAPGESGLIAVGGTATTLVAVRDGLAEFDVARVHGATLSREDVNGLLERMTQSNLAERCQWPGLERGRADVIVAGTIIIRSLLDWTGRSSMKVSARGLRWGLAERLAGKLGEM